MSLDQDLALFLTVLEEQFRLDSTDPLPAFEALERIAAYVWQTEEPARGGTLQVPWWVVQALAIGFRKYRDAAESKAPLTLGEAYKLEGGGQGKLPRIQRARNRLRDIRISLDIAFADADGVKIGAKLQEWSDATGLSLSQIRRIWKFNRKTATSSVQNFRNAQDLVK